jgi:hypothetical protein
MIGNTDQGWQFLYSQVRVQLIELQEQLKTTVQIEDDAQPQRS